MKEATGELNMTVITIVAIAAIAGFFYLFIWPAIQTNLALTTACNAAGGSNYTDAENGIVCTKDADGEVKCVVTVTDADGNTVSSGSEKTCN